nr:unnamed protein product [Callosobruchus chinensis]
MSVHCTQASRATDRSPWLSSNVEGWKRQPHYRRIWRHYRLGTFKNMVEFNASKTQYCSLSNKRCPSEHSVLMNNQALPRSHLFKLLVVSITENMIWHEHVASIATAAGKKLGYLFRARKYFSPSHAIQIPDKT